MAWPTNNPNHVPTPTRHRILNRDHHTCRQCGANHTLEIDHIDNTRNDTYDSDQNIQVLCKDCHKTKTQAEAKAAREQRHRALKRPTRTSFGLA